MPDAFDPYYKWLAIPPDEQPANHYRLLGLKAFESDPEVIETAADRQMGHVRTFQVGKHAAESQKLLNELSAARLCLLSTDKKAVYDQALRARLAQQQPVAPPAASAPSASAPLIGAKPVPAQAKPVRVAQAQPLLPVQSSARSAGSLDFDPLDQSSSPRHKRRKSAAPQPALLIGAGAALFAVVGLIWALAGGSSDAPQQLSAKPPRAADAASSDIFQDDVEPEVADRKPTRSPIVPPTSDESPAKENSADDVKDSADNEPVEPDQADDSMMPAADDVDDLDSADPEPAEPDAAPSRTAVPSAAALRIAIADIQSLLKAEFAAAKKPDQKIALAEKLLGLAKDSDASVERYALFSEGERLATSAGEFGLAMQAIDAIAEEFEVERLALAAEMVDAADAKEMPAAARKELVEIMLPLVDEAVATGQFKLARHLATAGLAAARKTNATDAAKTLARHAHDLAAQEKLAESADAARKLLETKPDDAEAHLTLGKYLCLVAGDWDAGLPHLKQGSDANLRTAAERELGGAETASERTKLGDLWWDLADEHKGADKDHYRARAGYWYEQAVGELTGLSKTKVEKRLADLPTATVARPSRMSKPVQFLSELKPKEVHVFGEIPLTNKVVVANVASPHGLFMHPFANGFARATYELPPGCRTLEGKVGIDDSISRETNKSDSGLTFRIIGDARELWKSRVLGLRNDSQDFRVSIADIKKLELFVDCPFNNGQAHSVWIEPRLTNAFAPVGPASGSGDKKVAGASGKATFLSNLPAHDVRALPGPSPALSFKGVHSAHGIYLHPASNDSSHAAYDLAGGYRSLSGTAGINDSAPGGGSRTALTFRIVGDGNELWKSRPLQQAGDSQEFRVSVARVDKLELFVDCPGDFYAAHAAWFEPKLTKAIASQPATTPAKSSPSKRTPFLSELEPQEVRNWGGVPITDKVVVAGVVSPHGLFMHPSTNNPAHVAYDLAGRHQTFIGKVGINDSAENHIRTTLTFRIVGDGKEIWQSRPLPKAGDAQDFEVSVAHVRRLELFVDCPGQDTRAFGVWFEPKLTQAGGAGPVPPSNVSKSVAVGKWIDLLPLVDPVRQHLEPDWRRTAAGLHVEKREGKLPIPMSVDGEYSLHVEFTRKTGRDTVVVILPLGSGQCMLALSGYDGAVSGLEIINGQELNASSASIRPGTLENEHRYSVDVTVHRAGSKYSIETKLDGKPHVQWSGEITSLRLNSGWTIPRRDVIALAGNEPTDFHVARFKLLSGKATIDADAVPQANLPNVAPVQNSPPSKSKGGLLKGAVLIATFDEPTITRKNGDVRVRDLSGKQKPGLLIGGSVVEGKAGQALDLQKVGDIVDWGTDASLNPPALTACAWIKPAIQTGDLRDFLTKFDIRHGNAGVALRLSSNHPEFAIVTGDGHWHYANEALPVPIGQWVHLAGTYDSNAERLYVNGRAAVSTPPSGRVIPSEGRFLIGTSDGLPDRQFVGLIDEVAVFDRALSAEEIQQIYELGKNGKSLTPTSANGH